MSLNVLIACKETEKEFYERKYGVGIENIRRACSDESKDIEEVLKTHAEHHENLEELVVAFKFYGVIPEVRCREKTGIHQAYLADDFKKADVVVSFGGDGEAIDIARNITRKSLGDEKARKVWIEKSDPDSLAALAVTTKYSYKEKVKRLISDDYKIQKWSRVQGTIKSNGAIEAEDVALNEIYFGDVYAMGMARYQASLGRMEESQRSSGGIISTKTGLLGWLLNTPAPRFGQYMKDAARSFFYWHIKKPNFENETLEYRVREPSKRKRLKLLSGKIQPGKSLIIKSKMNYDGCVSFDSSKPHYKNSRCYDFSRGKVLEARVSNEPLYVIRF
ncbi:MAG TPA: hypothetical protein VJ461_02085 [Candidatus Nanoarchaeia archaeon]|nr:hypothetical protein [Candidatus Nanoarchaeia archaeon]